MLYKNLIITFLLFLTMNFGFLLSNDLPKNYNDAIKYVNNFLNDEEREYIREMPYANLIVFHRSLGMKIRGRTDLMKEKDH